MKATSLILTSRKQSVILRERAKRERDNIDWGEVNVVATRKRGTRRKKQVRVDRRQGWVYEPNPKHATYAIWTDGRRLSGCG